MSFQLLVCGISFFRSQPTARDDWGYWFDWFIVLLILIKCSVFILSYYLMWILEAYDQEIFKEMLWGAYPGNKLETQTNSCITLPFKVISFNFLYRDPLRNFFLRARFEFSARCFDSSELSLCLQVRNPVSISNCVRVFLTRWTFHL